MIRYRVPSWCLLYCCACPDYRIIITTAPIIIIGETAHGFGTMINDDDATFI